jgi:hypothetical protein
MKDSDAIVQELRRLAEAHNGLLTPETVVSSAAIKSSPLHGCFTWDNSEAAAKWRLHQARNLLRVCVQVLPNENAQEDCKCKVFVSLTPDREKESGGYRLLTRVLSDAEQRAQLLADAMAELQTFEEKYKTLNELAEVFAASRKLRRRCA